MHNRHSKPPQVWRQPKRYGKDEGKQNSWSGRRDLNSRPLAPKASAAAQVRVFSCHLVATRAPSYTELHGVTATGNRHTFRPPHCAAAGCGLVESMWATPPVARPSRCPPIRIGPAGHGLIR